MNNSVLLVDDEKNILDGFKRQLRKLFNVKTALSGADALELLRNDSNHFGVVVSDMQMPQMNGVELLKRVRDINPDIVRIMLTGNADLKTAIDAVNQGYIFRFLTKPCSPVILAKSVKEGLQQYMLITSEKELLEKTLSGSVKVLTEILGLINPAAFGRSLRIGRYVEFMISKLDLKPAWHYKLAAVLSQIGCVTLPEEILNKVYNKMSLEENEKELYYSHPTVARNLIENIPRLGIVARMIEAQLQEFQKRTKGYSLTDEDPVALGGHLIKIAIDFDTLLLRGYRIKEAAGKLLTSNTYYLPEAVNAIEEYSGFDLRNVERSVNVSDLNTSMVLNEDIHAKNGMMIAVKGQEISYTMIQRLKSFSRSVGIVEPFNVLIKVAE